MKKLILFSMFFFSPVLVFARVSVSPSYFNFGTQALNTFSPNYIFSISNIGTVDARLSVSDVGCAGDFAVNNMSCYSDLATGASCSVWVQFRPYSEGYKTCTIYVRDFADGDSQQITIMGTAVR